jgi:hypothetical protein
MAYLGVATSRHGNIVMEKWRMGIVEKIRAELWTIRKQSRKVFTKYYTTFIFIIMARTGVTHDSTDDPDDRGGGACKALPWRGMIKIRKRQSKGTVGDVYL